MNNIGDTKKVKKYAWIPTILESKQIVWFTHYYAHMIYNTRQEIRFIANELIQNKILYINVTKWRTYQRTNQKNITKHKITINC